jgi:hypothetical protein
MNRTCLNVLHPLKPDALRIQTRSRVRLAIWAHHRESPCFFVFIARNQRLTSQVSLISLARRHHGSAEFTAAVDSPTQAP